MFLFLVALLPLSYGLITQIDDTAKLEPSDEKMSDFLPSRVFPYTKYMNMPQEEFYEKEEEFKKNPTSLPFYGIYISGESHQKQQHVAPSERLLEVEEAYYIPKANLLTKMGKEFN